MSMVGVDHHRNARQHSGDATERARFGGVGVDYVRTFSPKEPIQLPQGLQVRKRADRTRHRGDVCDLHSALFGVVGHVAFIVLDAARDEARAPGIVVERARQVRDVHRGTTDIEAGDDPVDQEGPDSHELTRPLRPSCGRSSSG